MIPAEENATTDGGKFEEEVDHATRIGTAIDVIAKKYELILGGRLDEDDERFQGGAAAVDVADSKRAHGVLSCVDEAPENEIAWIPIRQNHNNIG